MLKAKLSLQVAGRIQLHNSYKCLYMIEDKELEILQKEYESLCTQINSLMSSTDKIIGLGFTILAVALTLGLKDNLQAVILLVPFATIFVLFYAIATYSTVFSLGGYKHLIEEYINYKIGKNILIHEALVVKATHHSVAVGGMYALYFLFLLASIAFSIRNVLNEFGGVFGIGYITCLFIFLIWLWISISSMLKSANISYRIAQTAFRKEIRNKEPLTLDDRLAYLFTDTTEEQTKLEINSQLSELSNKN